MKRFSSAFSLGFESNPKHEMYPQSQNRPYDTILHLILTWP
jgi:hypothetical protein